MKKAVIFDMDGVVVNTEPLSHIANKKFYDSLGINVTDDVYSTFIGNSDKNIIQKIVDRYGVETDKEVLLEQCLNYYCDEFDNDPNLELMPGVNDLIVDLHTNGMILLLASSSSKIKIERVFTRFGLYPYFSHIISGQDFEFSKPHPAIFMEAVEKSGFTADECIVIEDSTNGIKAATAAGVYCIGYKSEEDSLQDTSLANEVITDFKQLSFERISDIK
ncbi:ABC transporter ATP-binding protein [Flavobacterium rivuli WB 3.3-2 = DSM 21788]|uniref:ABC transporter ATP-binding protein n=1 Tax=Flavobacterium rivuli WB 3.3-2 = DSM 21788 TaxID=1121895 RepID=A0A0A2MA23_9FLAO|nr:HAD family phosphatase [Flavobacterium rivuli]KGO85125.1 ABC transporter ATP-binding protein [Flavobacterium rivuli WB 3.3-2 = DSM 21788]